MTDKKTYRWLWSCLIAGGLLLSGCTDKSEELSLPSPEPQPPIEEVSQLELRAVTRTDGATPFTNDQNISIFLTTPTELESSGQFSYSATGWSSSVLVKEERQYYLYGYMPSSVSGSVSVSATDLNNDYSKGVDLTLSGMPAISSDDICMIVGVQRVTNTESSPAVTIGNFSYRSGIKGQNKVNLLMAHLYSGLELKFMIGEEYAKLRSIHLKNVTLKCTYPTVDATVNIRKGQGLGSPTFEKTSGSSNSNQTAVMLNEEKVLDTTTDEITTNMAYCAPILADGTSLTITSEYDVYDKSGPIDSRESTNTVKIAASALKPGQKNTITLTVKPTYLYVLSDNDFDIKVN